MLPLASVQGSLGPATATLALYTSGALQGYLRTHNEYPRTQGTCGLTGDTCLAYSHYMNVGESTELPPHLQTPYWGADYKHIS